MERKKITKKIKGQPMKKNRVKPIREYLSNITSKLKVGEIYPFNMDSTRKSNIPALWEAGGGLTNSGWATIIADKYYLRKEAIFIRTSGPLSNNKHALIGIEKGDHVIYYDFNIDTRVNEKFENIILSTIDDIDIDRDVAYLRIDNICNQNKWANEDDTIDEFAYPLKYAKKKADSYHCRVPIFVHNVKGVKLEYESIDRSEIDFIDETKKED